MPLFVALNTPQQTSRLEALSFERGRGAWTEAAAAAAREKHPHAHTHTHTFSGASTRYLTREPAAYSARRRTAAASALSGAAAAAASGATNDDARSRNVAKPTCMPRRCATTCTAAAHTRVRVYTVLCDRSVM